MEGARPPAGAPKPNVTDVLVCAATAELGTKVPCAATCVHNTMADYVFTPYAHVWPLRIWSLQHAWMDGQAAAGRSC